MPDAHQPDLTAISSIPMELCDHTGRFQIPPEVYEHRRSGLRKGIAKGYWFSLLPRHGVFLFAPNRGGERFARLFRETWGRLPLYARRRILKHWRSDPVPLPLFKPEIGLLKDWSGRETGRGLSGGWAVT